MCPMKLPSRSFTGPPARQCPAVNPTRLAGSTKPRVHKLVPCRISIPGYTSEPAAAAVGTGHTSSPATGTPAIARIAPPSQLFTAGLPRFRTW